MGSGGSGTARTVALKTEAGDSTPLAAGTVIAERYRVQHLMGEGGLGAVYQVEHVHMRKTFALKVLHGGNNAHPEVIARFEREAIAASHIEHPNVASATDFGRLPDGSFFLVLEYVAGRTLRSELKAGALPLERALRIARGIVAGVAAAHARGIVHRDLKPENIMLVDKPGQPDFVKLLDFGIARIESVGPVGREAAVEALTVSGVMIGTPDYMSPEQILGGTVDARSDLYSLGVVLFELVTGACPFRGEAISVLRQHLVDAPPSVGAGTTARVPGPIVEIVRKLLAKQQDDRFQTAAELAKALDDAALDLAAPAPTPALAPTELRSAPRLADGARVFFGHRRVSIWWAVPVVVLALSVWLLMRGDDRNTTSAPTSVAGVNPSPAQVAPRTEETTPVTASTTAPLAPSARGSATQKAGAPKGAGTRRTGPGGIYIPPPKDWFK